MIGKVIRGTNARRLLYYLFGPGKANEHTDPHLVAGFGDPADLEPERRLDGTRDFRRLAGLLAQPLAALDGPGYAEPVWHCAVRAPPEDRMLSDAEWAQVAAAVAQTAGQASNETEFFAGLRASGVLVRERFSEVNPGQVTGYAVTLPGCTGPDGTLRWYGGGRLADGLTLPWLRAAWHQGHGAGAERSGAYGFTRAERTEIYRHAARRAAAAAEHLRWCTVHDPERGADAAWAAADALHAAARATGSRVLRCAAEGYDRAARTPYGCVPKRTRDGEWLRATARLIAMAGRTSGDTTMLAAALVAKLVALADVVAALREAQAHAAQAAAARKAAEAMRAA